MHQSHVVDHILKLCCMLACTSQVAMHLARQYCFEVDCWPDPLIVCLLQVSGNITYNGKNFHEFQAVHTSAYVDQNDLHQAELTVRETLDFAARCQGIGHKGGQSLLQCRTQLLHQVEEWPAICKLYNIFVMIL